MNLVKNILARVLAFWAMLVFITSMLLIYIPFLISGLWPEPKRSIYFIRLSRIWMKVFFVLSGVRRIFKGKENFKKDENYIVVCNHNTFMDVPLSSPGIPGANKTIAKAEMAKIPLFGIMYSRGSVLVDRKSEDSRKTSFLRMKQVLDMGLHMCIYPEGTRNKTKEPLQRFHDGAFRLAVETGKAVVPSLIFYTAIVLPRKPFYFWPHRVEMHFFGAGGSWWDEYGAVEGEGVWDYERVLCCPHPLSYLPLKGETIEHSLSKIRHTMNYSSDCITRR